MDKTLIKEISQKALSAYINAIPMKDWYWPTIFPLRRKATINYSELIGEKGAPVMGDIVSFGSSTPEKRRDSVDKMFGQLVKTAVSRKMDEEDYNEYEILRNSMDTSFSDLEDYIWNDIDFVFKAIQARFEWMALQAVSKGKLSLSTSNNDGVVTNNDIDFKVPTKNQIKAQSAKWETTDTATPFKDLQKLNQTAKDNGHKINAFLMRQSDFDLMITADSVVNVMSQILTGQTSTSIGFGLSQVNSYIQTNLSLPPIKIVDQSLRFESKKGVRSTINPWEQNKVVGVPETQLGNMLHTKLPAEGRVKQATQSKRDNVLISKYSTVDPFGEWTKAEAISFPVMPAVNEMYHLDVSTT